MSCVHTNYRLLSSLQRKQYKENGFDDNQKQRYACKDCTRRFIGNHHLTYKGCHSQADELIWEMTARGNGICDICSITGYSKDKVQAALQRSEHEIEPTQKHYDVLQVDEFHTFVGHKKQSLAHLCLSPENRSNGCLCLG